MKLRIVVELDGYLATDAWWKPGWVLEDLGGVSTGYGSLSRIHSDTRSDCNVWGVLRCAAWGARLWSFVVLWQLEFSRTGQWYPNHLVPRHVSSCFPRWKPFFGEAMRWKLAHLPLILMNITGFGLHNEWSPVVLPHPKFVGFRELLPCKSLIWSHEDDDIFWKYSSKAAQQQLIYSHFLTNLRPEKLKPTRSWRSGSAKARVARTDGPRASPRPWVWILSGWVPGCDAWDLSTGWGCFWHVFRHLRDFSWCIRLAEFLWLIDQVWNLQAQKAPQPVVLEIGSAWYLEQTPWNSLAFQGSRTLFKERVWP